MEVIVAKLINGESVIGVLKANNIENCVGIHTNVMPVDSTISSPDGVSSSLQVQYGFYPMDPANPLNSEFKPNISKDYIIYSTKAEGDVEAQYIKLTTDNRGKDYELRKV